MAFTIFLLFHLSENPFYESNDSSLFFNRNWEIFLRSLKETKITSNIFDNEF